MARGLEAAMRGDDARKSNLLSYIDLEKRVRPDQPLRVIREIANAAVKSLSRDFDALYSRICCESIPPERLLRGCCELRENAEKCSVIQR
jgi:hypothetical protein